MFRPSSPPRAVAKLLSTLSCVDNINTVSIIAVVGRFEISVTARKNKVPAVWYRHRTINKTRMWPALKILLSSTELSPTITELSPNYQQFSPNYYQLSPTITEPEQEYDLHWRYSSPPAQSSHPSAKISLTSFVNCLTSWFAKYSNFRKYAHPSFLP